MIYRREIDGLRAVAVLPVILFHAGFTPFSGGYVGVDVFFVISGYLITSILLNEVESGDFSIARFYERRARRILPALFFVMLCCLPFAWMWMLPSELKDFSKSIIAVIFFASNILFWREEGYFAPSAELKPLLHTWSLAVEEQYYVLFPIFLLFAWRFGRERAFWSVCALAAISLVASEWGWRSNSSANFYLAPTRAWELLTGSICAFWLFGREQRAGNWLSIAGLASILFAIFFYDDATPFPSVYALVPVLGTALVIVFGGTGTWAAQLLGVRILVGVGTISYSAYLWHQPLFAFARIRSINAPSAHLMCTLAVASLILAYFSWRYVERPFRRSANSAISTQAMVFCTSAATASIFLAVSIISYVNNGFESRMAVPKSVFASMVRTKMADRCFDISYIHSVKNWNCIIGDKINPPKYFVFGDSHALSMIPAFDYALNNLHMSSVFSGASGCAPLLGIFSIRKDQDKRNCHDLNVRVFDYVKNNKNIKDIFLVARWSYYTDGDYDGNNIS